MSKSKLFHKPVPEDIALQLFSHVGLRNLHDSRWFRKRDIESVLNKISDDLYLIEPYYLPHRKFYVTRSMSSARVACIYRQIARSLGLSLEAMERGRFGEKQTYYRLVSPITHDTTFSVSFE